MSSYIKNLEQRNKHILKMALKSDSTHRHDDELLLNLMKFTKKQFYLLKDYGAGTKAMETEFEQLQKQVCFFPLEHCHIVYLKTQGVRDGCDH